MQISLRLTFIKTMPLKPLRQQIDQIDTHLLELLSQRMGVSQEIAKIKAANNLEIYDPAREIEVLQKLRKLGTSLNLNPEFVVTIYQLIFEEFKQIQRIE